MSSESKTGKKSVNKTIRFPLELAQQIKELIEDKDCSFSGFVIQACSYALDNLEESDEPQQ